MVWKHWKCSINFNRFRYSSVFSRPVRNLWMKYGSVIFTWTDLWMFSRKNWCTVIYCCTEDLFCFISNTYIVLVFNSVIKFPLFRGFVLNSVMGRMDGIKKKSGGTWSWIKVMKAENVGIRNSVQSLFIIWRFISSFEMLKWVENIHGWLNSWLLESHQCIIIINREFRLLARSRILFDEVAVISKPKFKAIFELKELNWTEFIWTNEFNQ